MENNSHKSFDGRDTDRLREEKERGISIELGFTYLIFQVGEEQALLTFPGMKGLLRTCCRCRGIDVVILVMQQMKE